MAKLTARQELFCQEYTVDYNGTKAAIRAGYKEDGARVTASRLLTNVNILARVRELQQEQVEQLAVSRNYVIQQLVDTYQSCREPTPVMEYDPVTGQMKETGTFEFDSKGALKALELIGRHLGMFNDKLQVENKMDTGQLDKVLAQLRGKDNG